MSATLSRRYLPFPGNNSIFSYFHIDLAVIGLAGMLFLAGWAANRFDSVWATPQAAAAAVIGAPPSPQGAPGTKSQLSPAMNSALESVAQRYRVSPEALQAVFETAQAAANSRGLDPLLIIAIIGIESGFNPYAQSPMGAMGLMQVIPRYHQDKLPKAAGKAAFLDPASNVQVGSQVLQEAIRRQGGLMEGLQYYGGVSDDPDQSYANRVITEKQRLEQAARRREAAPSDGKAGTAAARAGQIPKTG